MVPATVCAGLSLTASGFNAEGVGLFSNNYLNLVQDESDTKGHLFQGSYTLGKNRLALSYGKTKDEGVVGAGNEFEFENKAIALFHNVNKHLTLVAEYNQLEVDNKSAGTQLEETKTLALGVALNWESLHPAGPPSARPGIPSSAIPLSLPYSSRFPSLVRLSRVPCTEVAFWSPTRRS